MGDGDPNADSPTGTTGTTDSRPPAEIGRAGTGPHRRHPMWRMRSRRGRQSPRPIRHDSPELNAGDTPTDTAPGRHPVRRPGRRRTRPGHRRRLFPHPVPATAQSRPPHRRACPTDGTPQSQTSPDPSARCHRQAPVRPTAPSGSVIMGAPNTAATTSDTIAAARLLLTQMGLSPADLVARPRTCLHSPRSSPQSAPPSKQARDAPTAPI